MAKDEAKVTESVTLYFKDLQAGDLFVMSCEPDLIYLKVNQDLVLKIKKLTPRVANNYWEGQLHRMIKPDDAVIVRGHISLKYFVAPKDYDYPEIDKSKVDIVPIESLLFPK